MVPVFLGCFFLVETLSNTLRGSKKNTRKPIQGCNLCFFLDDVWFIILLMTNNSKKVGKRTFLFFPESCLFNLLVLGGFLWFMMGCFFYVWLLVIEEVHVWWFVESDIFFLMISQACKIWMMKFYPLSQWLGCCPNDLDVVPGGAISRTVAVAALNVPTSKFDADLLFADMFKRGKKKHPNTFPRKNLEGIFLVQGMEILVLAYMSSPKHHVSRMYLKLYLHDAVYILYARTNRRNVICPVYESAFNVWS